MLALITQSNDSYVNQLQSCMYISGIIALICKYAVGVCDGYDRDVDDMEGLWCEDDMTWHYLI